MYGTRITVDSVFVILFEKLFRLYIVNLFRLCICVDSGNMSRVVKNSYDHYSIWTACDAQGTQNEGYPKSWFYFEVGGFNNRKVTFSIHRVHFLYAMVKHYSYVGQTT